MGKVNKWRKWVILSGLGLVAFATPHLIDDFLFDIPLEFGLTNQQAQVLTGIFQVQLTAIFVWVAEGRSRGYFGTLFWAIFLFLAGLLRHVPEILKPAPYWSGMFSETLILGMMGMSIPLAICSLLAILGAKMRVDEI
jgi:hypothetical protein